MKITRFIAPFGLVMLATGCLAVSALVQVFAPHLLHHSVSVAGHMIGISADGSITPLNARPIENPFLQLLYFILSFFFFRPV